MKKYHVEFDIVVNKGNVSEWIQHCLRMAMFSNEHVSNFTCELVEEPTVTNKSSTLVDNQLNDTVTITWNVDPYSSAVKLMGAAPEGYVAVKLDRKRDKATITYKKIPKE